MSVIGRCWVCTHPEVETTDPTVMWDQASADWYRREGWTVVEFVRRDDVTGAVEALRELLPWVERVLPDGNVAAFNAALARARAIVGGQ